MSHGADGTEFTNNAYWGGKDKFGPIEGENPNVPGWMSNPLQEKEPLKESGTSIFVAGFRAKKDWDKIITAYIIQNFFAAIQQGALVVEVGEYHIDAETLSQLFGDEQIEGAIADYPGQPGAFRCSRNYFECMNAGETIHETSQQQHLGKTAVGILIGEEYPKKVAFVRNGMLITDNLYGLQRFSGMKNFVAVVQCQNAAGNELLSHLKNGAATAARLKASFPDFLKLPLAEISAHAVEQWRASRLALGRKPSTVNRDLNDLKAAMSRAVSWGYIAEHSLQDVKACKTDRFAKCRFLSDAELSSLMDALDERESGIREGRRSANEWRRIRGRELYPDLSGQAFADHLKPMVLISLNTGLRRGELFSLTWADIDFDRAVLSVRGETAKSGRTRHIPLNSKALAILKDWQGQASSSGDLVFPSDTGKKFDNVNSAWKALLRVAAIDSFRWHDMRHTFASRLVMAGVDLNTVRELLGHADYKMTLRYAHLAPSFKASAVERLVGPV